MITSKPAVGSVAYTADANAKMAAEMKEERMMKDTRWKESSMNVVYRRYKSNSDEISERRQGEVGARLEHGTPAIIYLRREITQAPKNAMDLLHQA